MSESTLINPGDSELDSVAAQILALDTPDAPATEGKPEENELSGDGDVSAEEPEASQAPADDAPAPEKAEAESDEEKPEETADDDEAKEPPINSIEELAKAMDVDPSEVMRLKLKTKIDGEEGEVTLADLVKSYQIEGHLSRKGSRLAEERQTFERSRQEAEAQIKQRAEQLGIQLALAQKRLLGEYGTIDWDTLRTQNPSLYQQKYIEYQQRYAELAQASQEIAREKQREQQMAVERHREYLAEQKRKLSNAVPEWNDRKVRDSELADIREYMKSREIDPKELDLVSHAGYALVLRDAKNWHKLQQEKKGLKKVVGEAPKIVRPGVRKSASQISQDKLKSLRERVRTSGHVNDVAAYLLANS